LHLKSFGIDYISLFTEEIDFLLVAPVAIPLLFAPGIAKFDNSGLGLPVFSFDPLQSQNAVGVAANKIEVLGLFSKRLKQSDVRTN